MNIAFVAYHSGVYKFCEGLMEAFKKRGHRVCFFYHVGNPDPQSNPKQMRWSKFSFAPLQDFKPSHVFMFNGWADETKPAAHVISSRWRTSFFEIAWLSQNGFIYVDDRGLGGRSALANTDLSATGTFDAKVWGILTKKYHPGRRPRELPKNYILVPLQLEHDTSIKYDSPYFKKMGNLIDFSLKAFTGRTVIIKGHPKEKAPITKVRGATVVTTEHKMNTLAAFSDAVVGINSTSLIESLVHLKPVATLGTNVLSGSRLWMSPVETLTSPKSLLKFKPDHERIKLAMCNLYKQQIPWKGTSPRSEEVCAKVEDLSQ